MVFWKVQTLQDLGVSTMQAPSVIIVLAWYLRFDAFQPPSKAVKCVFHRRWPSVRKNKVCLGCIAHSVSDGDLTGNIS